MPANSQTHGRWHGVTLLNFNADIDLRGGHTTRIAACRSGGRCGSTNGARHTDRRVAANAIVLPCGCPSGKSSHPATGGSGLSHQSIAGPNRVLDATQPKPPNVCMKLHP